MPPVLNRPGRRARVLALYNGTVFGTPIAAYEPAQPTHGRAALARAGADSAR
jgi:hypothetical protein